MGPFLVEGADEALDFAVPAWRAGRDEDVAWRRAGEGVLERGCGGRPTRCRSSPPRRAGSPARRIQAAARAKTAAAMSPRSSAVNLDVGQRLWSSTTQCANSMCRHRAGRRSWHGAVAGAQCPGSESAAAAWRPCATARRALTTHSAGECLPWSAPALRAAVTAQHLPDRRATKPNQPRQPRRPEIRPLTGDAGSAAQPPSLNAHGHDFGIGGRARKHARDARSASLACTSDATTDAPSPAQRRGRPRPPSTSHPLDQTNQLQPPASPSLHLPSSMSGPPSEPQSSLTDSLRGGRTPSQAFTKNVGTQLDGGTGRRACSGCVLALVCVQPALALGAADEDVGELEPAGDAVAGATIASGLVPSASPTVVGARRRRGASRRSGRPPSGIA